MATINKISTSFRKLSVVVFLLTLLSGLAYPVSPNDVKNFSRVQGNHAPYFIINKSEPSFFVMSMMQSGLLPEKSQQIDEFKKKMLDNTFEFEDMRQVSGLYHERSDTYFISEGHHRLAAALEIAKEQGDWSFFKKLIQKGYWSKTDTVPSNRYKLSMRTNWGNFLSCRVLLGRLVPSRGNLFSR